MSTPGLECPKSSLGAFFENTCQLRKKTLNPAKFTFFFIAHWQKKKHKKTQFVGGIVIGPGQHFIVTIQRPFKAL